jgi:hypothetical protein
VDCTLQFAVKGIKKKKKAKRKRLTGLKEKKHIARKKLMKKKKSKLTG